MKVDFFKHNLEKKDIENVNKVLNSLFLTTGETVGEFENKLAKYLGVKYAVGLTSCTAALHLSLLAYGIDKDNEVITSPMSFISTANAIEFTGAKPVFVDVEKNTGNINADLIEKAITKKTKAIIPVHLYGQLCDMKKIQKIANKYNLIIIEDAAHSLEAQRDGYRAGQIGNTASFSFYATKNITSGEGGAVVTNDKNIAEWLKKARLHGMSKSAAERYSKKYQHYDMEFLGWKYNMTNIQAAMLLNQLDKIEERLKKREKICQIYNNAFKNIKNIQIPEILPKTKPARYIYTIQVDPKKRDKIIHQLQKKEIGIAVNFRPIHLMKYYRKKYGYKKGMYPNAEKIGASTITLPLYPKLTRKEVRYIIRSVIDIIKK